MIITIARQCGCEGDEVGRKLSGFMASRVIPKKN